jgi:hypothetical protein
VVTGTVVTGEVVSSCPWRVFTRSSSTAVTPHRSPGSGPLPSTATKSPPYDEAELERLRSNGINDPEDDPTVRVQAPGAQQPNVFFQQVPEPKAVKNRVHLDLRCDSFEPEMKRLTALGARVVAEHDTFVVLLDPEGNEFCLSRRTAS